MRIPFSSLVALRALALAASLATAFAIVLAPGLAGAAVTPTGITDAIHIELVKGKLKFDAPEAVTQGDELEIVNETNPKQVGPHTFSLVTRGSLPKTGSARRNCSAPKHICFSIAKWHGFDPKTEEITINPAKAGPEGWSTPGSTSTKGDSWLTGEKPRASIAQEVTAEPGTLYFMCAIHPWMQGRIDVVAPTSFLRPQRGIPHPLPRARPRGARPDEPLPGRRRPVSS